jgi:mono/diheme cytochrome c family protein
MMRIRWGSARVRTAFVLAICALTVAGAYSLTAHAQQTRTVADGVFATGQAQQGRELYTKQCVACHGDKLQGVIGPMLAGEGFLSAWGGRSLAELVDKIQLTMPPTAPKTLTRDQAISLASYLLQTGNFRAGQTALTDAALAQVTFPAAKPSAAAAAGGVAITPASNLAQFMRGVTFPNANILFNAQVKDPGALKPTAPVPFDYVLWGMTQYYGWQSVDQAALALIETTPLFLLPGRRCENGRPVPVNKADYQQTTQALIELSKELYKVSQSRSAEKLAGMSERLNEACDACHRVYRDVSATGKSVSEGGVSADRCRQ